MDVAAHNGFRDRPVQPLRHPSREIRLARVDVGLAKRRAQVGHAPPVLLGDLAPGVAQHREAGPAQDKVAVPVALDRGGSGMCQVTVELDDHPVVGPQRIDDEALDSSCSRAGVAHTRAFAEEQKPLLELTASQGELGKMMDHGLA